MRVLNYNTLGGGHAESLLKFLTYLCRDHNTESTTSG